MRLHPHRFNPRLQRWMAAHADGGVELSEFDRELLRNSPGVGGQIADLANEGILQLVAAFCRLSPRPVL
jgi:hypothetical protein